MASYHYWLVYLPQYNPSSFLLYTGHAGGEMALRDYSEGRPGTVLQPAPLRGKVLQATVDRVTRFCVEPRTVEDVEHWVRTTAEYNRAELSDAIVAVEIEGD
jgi:hypothetical protein